MLILVIAHTHNIISHNGSTRVLDKNFFSLIIQYSIILQFGAVCKNSCSSRSLMLHIIFAMSRAFYNA